MPVLKDMTLFERYRLHSFSGNGDLYCFYILIVWMDEIFSGKKLNDSALLGLKRSWGISPSTVKNRWEYNEQQRLRDSFCNQIHLLAVVPQDLINNTFSEE